MTETSYLHPPAHDRVASGVATGVVMAALGAGLLFGLAGGRVVGQVGETLRLISIPLAPPPPRHRAAVPAPRRAAASAPSPPNLHNRATPVTAPPPIVPLAPPPPLVVAARPATGVATQSGTSDRAGSGQGSGGQGDGFGAGGEGDGDGGYVPPRQIKGRLKNSDLPEELVHQQDAQGRIGKVAVKYRVEVDGRVSDCVVTVPSGKPLLDATTCRLIVQRYRFKPSIGPSGRPVGSYVEDTAEWGVIREEEPGPRD